MNIVVTGASRGLGLAIAERFALEGHNLYLCSLSKSPLLATAASLAKRYPAITIHAAPFDLSLKEGAEAFGKWVLGDLAGRGGSSIDVLVNNAGQFLPGTIQDEPAATLEKMIAVNLYSAYHLTRILLPQMISVRKGHIFNICSIASLQAYPDGGSYSISKYALSGFSKNLREELKPSGIKVTSVYPGAVYTGSWAGSGVDPNRLMEAADIAQMIFACTAVSPNACVEELVLRPQLGDL